MADADLDLMADLLGDPEVMHHDPRPKTCDEALEWIRWNRRSYAEMAELRDPCDSVA